MTVRLRHLRLRAETSTGPFGADIPLDVGLNVLRADNTTGKSTCLQGLLYALGLERMLSPRREIPLAYVMTSHLDDPGTGQRHPVLESAVWVELENSAGDVITVRRGVVTSTDRKLVSVFNGPLLTQPANHYRQRDYFVLDPGAAHREAGFHRMLAEFIGWRLPTVRRYDGSETTLYIETIFPLLYVEQKAGWSSLPAAFPTYFQIRDVGLRIPAQASHLFRSMPAGHSGGCRPPVPAQAGHPTERRMTLDSPCLGVPSCEPISGGTLWRLSDYPCEPRARFSV